MTRSATKGLSTMEAMIGGVIVILGVVATMSSFRYIGKSRAGIESTDAIDRIDNYLRKVLQARVADHFVAVGAGCNAAAFLQMLNFDSAAGLRITVMDPASAVPNATDGPRARVALGRCNTQQTAYTSVATFPTQQRIHFCVWAQPTPGDADAAESFAGLQRVFGEFTFRLANPVNGASYGCRDFMPFRRQVAAMVSYGMYWSSAEGTPRTLFGNSILGSL